MESKLEESELESQKILFQEVNKTIYYESQLNNIFPKFNKLAEDFNNQYAENKKLLEEFQNFSK